MAVSKVELANGEVLIDLTNDSVTAETLAEGVTAHGADGEPIVGKMSSSGGGDDVAGAIVDRTVTEFINNKATKIGDYALRSCTKLTRVDAPNATSIGQYAFAGCSLLASVNFSKVESVGTNSVNRNQNCNDHR